MSDFKIPPTEVPLNIKAKYLGKSDPFSFIKGKVYDIIGKDEVLGWYRVIDETGFDPEIEEYPGYLYGINWDEFEIVSGKLI
ncbi:MAG: hypothetical protein LIO87_05635 [Eubacterium sp.]|nr:hypothetical protein [Eubacterium sp.]